MSTGIGRVPAEQTYLDISQGTRIDDALYDRPLPPLPDFMFHVPRWQQIVQRADSAPAEIVPGLLASSLLSGGIRSEAAPAAESAELIAATRNGAVGVSNFGRLSVFSSGIGVVRKEATRMPADGLLIAFTEPSPGRQTVPLGIAGGGFAGNLTSDSTRTDGYVLSTDLAPTILRFLGQSIPDQMDGEPIRSVGNIDPTAVDDLQARMRAIPDRRAPVVILSLVSWIVAATLVGPLLPGLRRGALAWLALAFAYMPLMLLAGAALEPSAVAEGLIVGLGAAALAALTLAVARGWWALVIACAITVIAYAIDVMTGSELTKLSLLGPNPIFGVRFYGIGNELEALIAVMVPVGVRRLPGRGGARRADLRRRSLRSRRRSGDRPARGSRRRGGDQLRKAARSGHRGRRGAARGPRGPCPDRPRLRRQRSPDALRARRGRRRRSRRRRRAALGVVGTRFRPGRRQPPLLDRDRGDRGHRVSVAPD
jgi:hypothetical protein